MVEGMTARMRTMEDWAHLFNGRKPTDEEMQLVVETIAKDIEEAVDQGFVDGMDEMIKRLKPTMPLSEQKRVTLLRDAIRVCEAKGQDTSDLQEDLAYLENKFKGQPREQ